METTYDRNYIDARETLLDAVEALGPHSDGRHPGGGPGDIRAHKG